MINILLIGNPNCGKTTLFNILAGENQQIGNWAGVTVEKKSGFMILNQNKYELIDLPGVYSLTCMQQTASIDELITMKVLSHTKFDLIINVIDACNLERHLYLTSQLLELNKPIIIALNMLDLAHKRGINIDIPTLSQKLHCPIIPLQAHKKIGIQLLQEAIQNSPAIPPPLSLSLSASQQQILTDLNIYIKNNYTLLNNINNYSAWRYAEGDDLLINHRSDFVLPDDFDIIMADSRYDTIHKLIEMTQICKNKEHLTAKIDNIILNRYLALPLFLLIMYFMFTIAINVGGVLQDFVSMNAQIIFVEKTTVILKNFFHAPQWLIAILANGLGIGISTVLTFIPVLTLMFMFLSFLETSGYMARTAFIVDRLMRIIGLPGKAFIPMIIGFGCNVPAIMATRTLNNTQDRILTIMMSPFMSCSARLAIYTTFTAIFFPHNGQNIIFALYIIGIIMAILTGLMLKKTILRGPSTTLLLELPAYHKPSLMRIFKETKRRLYNFIIRSGSLILPLCVIIGGINNFNIQSNTYINNKTQMHSLLLIIGQWLTPIFTPIGINIDNWPATVGLLTGVIAKEVVIGTLNTLYTQLQHLSSLNNIILSHFHGKIGAFAYLLFILLYIPCVSTIATIKQETNNLIMCLSVIWSTLIAYVSAMLFYQIATIMLHPQQSLILILYGISSIIFFILILETICYYKSANLCKMNKS